jgi:hypothetical protein
MATLSTKSEKYIASVSSINNYFLNRSGSLHVSYKITETKENLLTRQSSLFKRERRGDSQRVIANRLTSQQAL